MMRSAVGPRVWIVLAALWAAIAIGDCDLYALIATILCLRIWVAEEELEQCRKGRK
jgi:hypothetical protein